MTRILAIDCATEACSVALFEHGEMIAHDHQVLGRGHAERLIPTIASLPGKGQASEIRVSLGPGSFTGVRIGLAAARALGIAWGAKVLGYPTLALVAAAARSTYQEPVTVCMAGGHGEWFIQNFGQDGLPENALVSMPPDKAAEFGNHRIIAGNKANAKADGAKSNIEDIAGKADGSRAALDILPDTAYVLNIPNTLLTEELIPIYGRAPDAKLPG